MVERRELTLIRVGRSGLFVPMVHWGPVGDGDGGQQDPTSKKKRAIHTLNLHISLQRILRHSCQQVPSLVQIQPINVQTTAIHSIEHTA